MGLWKIVDPAYLSFYPVVYIIRKNDRGSRSRTQNWAGLREFRGLWDSVCGLLIFLTASICCHCLWLWLSQKFTDALVGWPRDWLFDWGLALSELEIEVYCIFLAFIEYEHKLIFRGSSSLEISSWTPESENLMGLRCLKLINLKLYLKCISIFK